ncbi:MAG: hypothetical protein ACRDOE_00480 [Streptosporangiaceae bacterium]
MLVEFRAEIDLHLGAPQGAQVLLDVCLTGVKSGHQEPDHERGVEDLAEPEGLGDVERHPPRRGRRDLPVKQRVQALVGRALEGERHLIGSKHGLKGLYGGEMAPGVVTDSERHSGQVLRTADGRVRWHDDGAGRHRVCRGHELTSPFARRGVGGPVAGAADVSTVAARPERLERARLDLSGVVSPHGTNAVVPAEHEAVLQPFGREVALLFGDPLLQSAMRHDLQRHS